VVELRDSGGVLIGAASAAAPGDALVLQRPVKDGLPTPVNHWMQGRQTFDRKHWNALMTAECIKTMLGRLGRASEIHTAPAAQLAFPYGSARRAPVVPVGSGVG